MSSKGFNPIGSPISWLKPWINVLPFALALSWAVVFSFEGFYHWISQVDRGSTFPRAVIVVPLALLMTPLIEWWRISRKYAGRTLLTINLSSEANNILKNLAKRTGGDEADVLRKSLALMELSMQARERGLAVGATDHPEALQTEFTGFTANHDG